MVAGLWREEGEAVKVWVFSICWNEAALLPWFLRHYETFADKIIIWDENSDDGSRQLIKAHSKCELRDWPYKGLDDEKFLHAVNQWHREAIGKADWIIWPDIDELLYHPTPLAALATPNGDVIPAKGYALIASEPPDLGSAHQIYDVVRTGYRQENYDKRIIWRTHVEMQHTIGRHTYGNEWPRFKGRLATNAEFKLLHCHHLGGVEFTRQRNRRNYGRAVNKKFAWNYAPGERSAGTEHWVKDLIHGNKLIDVMANPLKKLHLGCGGMKLDGWENYDVEMDIRKPLPFGPNAAQFIFAEHVIEHVTHQEAWRFLEECKRVLIPGGVLRVAIPDLERIWVDSKPDYWSAVKAGGHGDGTREAAARAAVFSHGHQAAWTSGLLFAMMSAVGFKAVIVVVGESEYPELKGIEQHGKTVGESIAKQETSVMEGVVPKLK